MDKFPLLYNGESSGELIVERESLYTWFEARCRLPEEGLWCAWAVGEGGELRLGILEPSGEAAVIRRRFSHRLTDPLKRLLQGEIRPASAGEERREWKRVEHPETLFQSPWLRSRLGRIEGMLLHREKNGCCLAIPYNKGNPFPMTTLFCFASIQCIGGMTYAVFAFDGSERPIFLP